MSRMDHLVAGYFPSCRQRPTFQPNAGINHSLLGSVKGHTSDEDCVLAFICYSLSNNYFTATEGGPQNGSCRNTLIHFDPKNVQPPTPPTPTSRPTSYLHHPDIVGYHQPLPSYLCHYDRAFVLAFLLCHLISVIMTSVVILPQRNLSAAIHCVNMSYIWMFIVSTV